MKFSELAEITGNIKLTDKAKCKICGRDDFTLIGELGEHMNTHKEFVDAMEKILPNYGKIMGIDLK